VAKVIDPLNMNIMYVIFIHAVHTPYWSIFTHNIGCGTRHKGDRTPFILEKRSILTCGY
jgi:hypothetical protein